MKARKNTAGISGLPSKPVRALANIEIVTLAVYVLGGEARYVDTEDVAFKANELAPGRFTWVKYPEQINIHTVKTYLWDAKSDRRGSLLLGSEKDGWMLSANGLELARSRVDALKGVKATRKKPTAAEQRWRSNERVRMLSSDAYRKLKTAGTDAVTAEEAESFFRLNAYVVGQARERKITRILNMFGDDADLGPAVQALVEKVRST